MQIPILAATLAATPICAPADESVRPPDLRALYARGVDYGTFMRDAQRRVDWWRDHYANAAVPDATLARVRAVAGTWRLLVIAVDGCSDSANTIPYVAKLVELAPNIEMRIVNSTLGREIMEAHRTPDGRAATPTVLLLNERYEEVGCFVERPQALQEWYLEAQGTMRDDELFDRKIEWYANDAGRSTIEEIVGLLEGAAAGTPVCAAVRP